MALTVDMPDGRSYRFGNYVNEDYAMTLLRRLLDVEQHLAEGTAKGADEREMGFLNRAVQSAQQDIEAYQEKSSSADNLAREPVSEPSSGPTRGATTAKGAMTAGERAIVNELQQIRLATLADKEIVPHPLTGEMTRSRVVLPTGENE